MVPSSNAGGSLVETAFWMDCISRLQVTLFMSLSSRRHAMKRLPYELWMSFKSLYKFFISFLYNFFISNIWEVLNKTGLCIPWSSLTELPVMTLKWDNRFLQKGIDIELSNTKRRVLGHRTFKDSINFSQWDFNFLIGLLYKARGPGTVSALEIF